jgi:hypothetical protein
VHTLTSSVFKIIHTCYMPCQLIQVGNSETSGEKYTSWRYSKLVTYWQICVWSCVLKFSCCWWLFCWSHIHDYVHRNPLFIAHAESAECIVHPRSLFVYSACHDHCKFNSTHSWLYKMSVQETEPLQVLHVFHKERLRTSVTFWQLQPWPLYVFISHNPAGVSFNSQ